MPGSMIEFKTNGRTAAGYLARPTAPRGHGILVIQEYWGLVANHHIAFAWTFHPPCGRMNSSQVRGRKARASNVARRAKRQTKRAA